MVNFYWLCQTVGVSCNMSLRAADITCGYCISPPGQNCQFVDYGLAPNFWNLG